MCFSGCYAFVFFPVFSRSNKHKVPRSLDAKILFACSRAENVSLYYEMLFHRIRSSVHHGTYVSWRAETQYRVSFLDGGTCHVCAYLSLVHGSAL